MRNCQLRGSVNGVDDPYFRTANPHLSSLYYDAKTDKYWVDDYGFVWVEGPGVIYIYDVRDQE
jgi:hypothetical protein